MHKNLKALLIVIVLANPKLANSFLAVLQGNSSNTSDNSSTILRNKHHSNFETLVLVQVLFRHGDRTPWTDYKNNPYHDYKSIYGVEGLHQLTPIGRNQAYNLGRYLRQRYNSYLRQNPLMEDVYLQCSNYSHTVKTAVSCLKGMFDQGCLENVNLIPGKGRVCQNYLQRPVPVHVIPTSEDNKIANTKTCKKYQQLYDGYLNSKVMQDLNRKNEAFYEFLQRATGNQVTFFEDVYHINDTLLINEFYGLALPDWTKNGVYPERTTLLANIRLTIPVATKEMERLYVGPILEELIANMDARIFGATPSAIGAGIPAKICMYSGHDTTIAPFLIALGVYDGVPPPYTTLVALELHKVKHFGKWNYHVKLFYRPERTKHKMYELHPVKCGEPCTLETFKEAYSSVWKTSIGWDAECNTKK